MRKLFLFSGLLLPIFGAVSILASSESARTTSSFSFDPLAFDHHVAICPGIDRSTNKTVDLHLRYVDINSDPASHARETLLLLHGWPSLWASWKYQIREFAGDYRLIIPDIRGFGPSTHPGDDQSSGSMPDLVGDIMCILHYASVSKAVVIGHDWGALLAYEAARERPDIFTAVVGITVPYMPAAGPYVPVSALVPTFPHLAYQVYFAEHTATAVAELGADIRRTLRATLRTVASPPPPDFLLSNTSYLRAWKGVDTIPPIPFFDCREEDYWVSQYSIQGFKYTLEFYTNANRLESYIFAHGQGNITIPQPALSILPTQDPVGDWELAAKVLQSAKFLPRLTQIALPGSHWVQLEYPDQVNALIRNFLRTLGASHLENDQTVLSL